jgi:hypothetical protein
LLLEIVTSGCYERPEFNGGIMRPTFEIFADSPDDEPVWIESVENLKNAREPHRQAREAIYPADPVSHHPSPAWPRELALRRRRQS